MEGTGSEGRKVEASTAFDLAGMIDVQEGSVVSRTLVDREVGTITVFAFDAGQGLSEHTAPYDAFVQVLEGEAHVMIGGEAHHVGAGQIIIMPANVPHSLHAAEPFKMLLVMIRSR
jgi:quercetin dioxygenase-like cupin family protein